MNRSPSSLPQRTWLICPLVSNSVSEMREGMRKAEALGADAVECRLDFLSVFPCSEDLRCLLTDAPLPVIVTCRPVREGGKCEAGEEQRLAILREAASLGAAYVDVEMDTPLEDRPSTSLIASTHDFQGVPDNLRAIFDGPGTEGASVVKTAFLAHGPEDALRALELVRDSARPAIALAMGEAGVPSRILARKVGAMGTFASLGRGAESAPGQPTVSELRDLYRWESLGPDTVVCGVIGCPVGHSMSPAIHNAAFSALGVDAVYVPLLIQPGEDSFRRFMDALLERAWMDWRGLSVTIPHKENALQYVGQAHCAELACRIGAVNTITISPDGKLRGDNTDYIAALDALCNAMGIQQSELSGRSVAVLGAGGVARAIVAALAHHGAEVTVYNRTATRAEALGEEFGVRAQPLEASGTLSAEIVINCTPIGMFPRTDATPLAKIPSDVRVVFDTIYNPVRTRLLTEAQRAGCRTISGVDMFVGQAAAQFELWMGRKAPLDAMRGEVLRRLGESG
jgi:3-dehydroquinate dehydratase / shikimate dehydrogenase